MTITNLLNVSFKFGLSFKKLDEKEFTYVRNKIFTEKRTLLFRARKL